MIHVYPAVDFQGVNLVHTLPQNHVFDEGIGLRVLLVHLNYYTTTSQKQFKRFSSLNDDIVYLAYMSKVFELHLF